MVSFMYTAALDRLVRGDLVWDSSDIRLLLLDDAGSYTPDRDDVFVADLAPSSNELDTTGYERKTLAGLDVQTSGGSVLLLASDVVWGPLGVDETVQAAVVYEQVSDDSDSRLVAYLASGKSLNGGGATWAFPAGRVIELTSPSW